MKNSVPRFALIALGLILGSAAYAQGRHDERPHGAPKKSEPSAVEPAGPSMGGRHDDRPHGVKKKKQETAKPEGAAGATAGTGEGKK